MDGFPEESLCGVFVAAGRVVWEISLAPGTGAVANMVVGGSNVKGDGWDVRKLSP
jgi:hypothetical protein